MAKLTGLHHAHPWVQNRNAAQEMMSDPDAFFQAHPQKTSDYACPEAVHEALERGRALGEAMIATCAASEGAGKALPDSLKSLRETVTKHFGADFVAETMPFGILFKERASAANLAITGTGSCTFCKDNDSPDVD